jgi:hypothetical protein
MVFKQTLGAVAILCAIETSATGAVFYDNFGPGNTYQTSSGYGFGGSDPNFKQAMAFTPNDSCVLTAGDFGISLSFGQNPSTFSITVHADAGGLPGTVLEQKTVVTNLGPFGLQNSPVAVNFAGTTALNAGAQYWISMSATGFNSFTWNGNNTGDIGLRAFQSNNGTWIAASGNEAIGAFRLHGTIVPAPAVIALLGLALCAPRRRRR